jgi:hypothetical protein
VSLFLRTDLLGEPIPPLQAEPEMARHISVISRCCAPEKAERHDSISSLNLEIKLGEGKLPKEISYLSFISTIT